jgi:hypothetical protein
MNPTAAVRTCFLQAVLTALLCATSYADAQPQRLSAPPQTVQWRLAVAAPSTLQPGQRTTLELTGQILAGWHVYGLEQHPHGPTQLQFGVDDNSVAEVAGAPVGSAPISRMDPAFGFQIQYYTDSLTLRLPIRVKQHARLGKQQVPVAVRFQSCSERTCLPPATVHLMVEIDVGSHA